MADNGFGDNKGVFGKFRILKELISKNEPIPDEYYFELNDNGHILRLANFSKDEYLRLTKYFDNRTRGYARLLKTYKEKYIEKHKPFDFGQVVSFIKNGKEERGIVGDYDLVENGVVKAKIFMRKKNGGMSMNRWTLSDAEYVTIKKVDEEMLIEV